MAQDLVVPDPPQALSEWLAARDRADSVLTHGFQLSLDWWNKHLSGLPGSPLTSREGDTSGVGWVDRSAVFALAPAAMEDESGNAALRLLWYSLWWGSGESRRNNKQRIASVDADPQFAGSLLRDAARLASESPRDAFKALIPKRPAIAWLGPSYVTKYLYFAGAGRPTHPCSIVDARVMTTLHRELRWHQFAKPRQAFGPKTYEVAMRVLSTWAERLSTIERVIAPDEVERWAFAVGK